jgi:hypothetical protein
MNIKYCTQRITLLQNYGTKEYLDVRYIFRWYIVFYICIHQFLHYS